jgi:hypothetical protein
MKKFYVDLYYKSTLNKGGYGVSKSISTVNIYRWIWSLRVLHKTEGGGGYMHISIIKKY